MHGILASMAEFYSLNLAQEVLKGMTQKASMGGTPAKAPLGYLNVRTTDAKGREVRDVTVDPERADLVTFAFTAYATGNWTLSSLAKELEARGLTTRPTPSFPAKPVTTKALHKVLTNPYYQGSVTFRGITYDGAHDPLVDTETWLRVQTELAAKNQRGEKPRTHDHYLKGTLYCSCGAKMMIECPTGKSGITYEYFTCSGRRKKNGCTRSAILTDRIEDRIDSTYGTNGLTPAEADRVREVLGAVFDQLEATTDHERALLTTQKEKLDAERLKLVQAHYADAIPLDLLKAEQDRIRATLDAIEHRLENLATSYEDAREGLDQLADILTDLGDVYTRCEPAERRILNRALFDKIILDDEETVRYQPDQAVQAALDCVIPGHAPIAEAEASDPEDTSNPARWSAGQGSKMSLLVVLRRCFSNPGKPLRSLISRVHKASRPRGAGRPATQRGDARGTVVEKSRQSQTRLNASNRAALLDSYAAEVPVHELADRFGVHRSTVSELVRRAGVPTRSPGLPESIRREAARLYEEGLTLPKVAARLGISNDGARAGIVACGGTIRPRGRQPARR